MSSGTGNCEDYKDEYTCNFLNLYSATMRARSSAELVRDLTYIAVSTISYMSKVYPVRVFDKQLYDVINVNLLKPQSAECRDLYVCMEKAFEAIDNGYLEQTVVEVYHKKVDPDHLLTSYILEYRYKEGPLPYYKLSDEEQRKFSMKEIRDSIREMVQAYVFAVSDAEISDVRYRARGTLYFGIHLYYNNKAPDLTTEDVTTGKCFPTTLTHIASAPRAVLDTLHHQLQFRAIMHGAPAPCSR